MKADKKIVIDQQFATRIRRVSLTAFRNYQSLRLDLSTAPVVLVGANGSGKTNLLEAISLLAPGRGLRKAALHELQNRSTPTPWAVAVEMDTPAGFTTVSTGADPSDPERDGRLVRIDAKPAKSQAALAAITPLVWLTPEMDRVLAESPSARRKLLDRLVFGFDPAHAGRVNRYENTLRERMRLLRDGVMDAAWLNALEDELARTGMAIAVARRQMTAELNLSLSELDMDEAFARPSLALSGLAEDMLDHAPALTVEDTLRARLAAARTDDQRTGTTAIGPHRSDWVVTHAAKNTPANLCSTGEQKALLIRLMLGYMRLIADWRKQTPLMLLDDIASHLDERRRTVLFDTLTQTGAQFWITGTDADLFATLQTTAQVLRVQDNRVQAA